jgi:hypothetical protein
MNNIWVYDWEVLNNFASVIFKNASTNEVFSFVIHESRNDTALLNKFLNQNIRLVGYNCINFDAHLTEYIKNLKKIPGVTKTINDLKKIAQKRIEAEGDYWGALSIPHRDLMKIWHFDPKGAKACSLKWLQVNMKFKNVQDMPIHHTEDVTADQIPLILEYNLNDVKTTLELYKRSFKMITMRNDLTKEFNIDVNNFPNAKIGEYIVLKLLSDKIGMSIDSLKKCRTVRSQIVVKDILLKQIKFESNPFKNVLSFYESLIYKKDEKLQELCYTFDSLDYYLGLGGCHASREAGLYSNIHSCDVTGYYPSLAVAQRFAPEHLGMPFVEVYSELPSLRARHEKGTSLNMAYKEAQVSVFGKSGNEFSPFYDLQHLIKTTINGQLALLMLCEQLTLQGAATVLTANTDGIEVEMLDQAKYDEVCKWWEDLFNLKLEHSKYKVMALQNINNYLAIKEDLSIKVKGAQFLTDPELHQNHSQLIVPKAIKAYLSEGTPVENFINNETSIDDFLLAVRAKTGHFTLKTSVNGEVKEEPLPKTVRYYISTKGGIMMKYTDKKREKVHMDSKITVFNQWVDGPYDIDKSYYIGEAKKILRELKPRKIVKYEQYSLF